MKKFKALLVAMVLASGASIAQEAEVVKFDRVETIMQKKSDKLQVINFWATWCKPCIVEMPYFEKIADKYADSMELTFISLDFADQLDKKVKPFLTKREIKSKVLLLDNTDYNSWINKVDTRWSGAIPATIIIEPGGEKHFYEQEFKQDELESLITDFIK